MIRVSEKYLADYIRDSYMDIPVDDSDWTIDELGLYGKYSELDVGSYVICFEVIRTEDEHLDVNILSIYRKRFLGNPKENVQLVRDSSVDLSTIISSLLSIS